LYSCSILMDRWGCEGKDGCFRRPAYAGLFVRTENELIPPEFTALPEALVEIQKSAGFLFEVWVSRKDPAAMLPRTDGVLVEPTPYGGIAEGSVRPVLRT
jgi:hypothetical protein